MSTQFHMTVAKLIGRKLTDLENSALDEAYMAARTLYYEMGKRGGYYDGWSDGFNASRYEKKSPERRPREWWEETWALLTPAQQERHINLYGHWEQFFGHS